MQRTSPRKRLLVSIILILMKFFNVTSKCFLHSGQKHRLLQLLFIFYVSGSGGVNMGQTNQLQYPIPKNIISELIMWYFQNIA